MKEVFAVIATIVYVIATIGTLIANNMVADVMGRLAVVLVAVIVYVSIVWIISLVVRRLDIVDIAWGGGFVVAAITSFVLNPHNLAIGWNVQTLTTALVIVWAVRLGYYILRRVLSHPEDKRYQDIRAAWKGQVALNAYLRIFVTQGVLATIVSIAIVHINLSPSTEIGWVAFGGVIVWSIGFLFESIGDQQLKEFLSQPKNRGRLMTDGLWRYTRHPNYFGESVQWWGIFVIGLSTMFGWVGIVTPLLITYLLIFVSGVALSEKRYEGRSGWAEYKKRTSMFVPLSPKQLP